MEIFRFLLTELPRSQFKKEKWKINEWSYDDLECCNKDK